MLTSASCCFSTPFFGHLVFLEAALFRVLGDVVVQIRIQRFAVKPNFEAAFTGPRAAGLNPFFTLVPGQWIALDAADIQGWEPPTHRSQGCPDSSFSCILLSRPNIGNDKNTILSCADLSIPKTNKVNTLVTGPSSANNAVFKDPITPGSTSMAVACTDVSHAADCPAPANVSFAVLPESITLQNSFPASSSLMSEVSCSMLWSHALYRSCFEPHHGEGVTR